MDIASIFGVILALAAVVTSFTLEGGNADNVFLIAPIILVVGGSVGVAVVGGPHGIFGRIPTYFRIAFFTRTENRQGIIDQIVGLAERARREGVLSLEKQIKAQENKFFAKSLTLVIDGVEGRALSEILHAEINSMSHRHRQGIDFFNRLGGFSPTLGILGTVLALVHTLSRVDNPENMAASIASAFIATLWGVGMANMVYLPIADKLKLRHEEEVFSMELIAEGALAIQSGETPRLIRRRLQSFLAPDSRPGEY